MTEKTRNTNYETNKNPKQWANKKGEMIECCPYCIDWEQNPIELDEGSCSVCGWKTNEDEAEE